MGRQKPQAVLNLSQNHKQFKQRVHMLNSALSNQNINIKIRQHDKIDKDSFISLQTKNTNTFTPNLMECILFPIFTTTHSQSSSSETIQLISKHSQRSKKKNKNKAQSSLLSSSTNFNLNFDINDKVYMHKAAPPSHQSADYFTDWQSRLLLKHVQNTLKEHMEYLDDDTAYEYDTDIYIANNIKAQWPSTYGESNQYLNPNFTEHKEAPYDVSMLRCAQRCFGDILFNEFTFDNFVHLVENRYNFYFWTYHEEEGANKKAKRIHFNKRIANLCRQINVEIQKGYFVFMEKEIEFRLRIVMGNKKLLKQQRSAHIAPLSVFAIQKSMDKISSVIKQIDLEQIHSLEGNIILKWTQLIRDAIGNIESLLKDIQQLKYIIIQHLYQFGSKFKKYLKDIRQKINEKRQKEGKQLVNDAHNEYNDMALIYIYKTNEILHRDESGYDIVSQNMYKHKENKNAYEVHMDIELCDFAAYLNYYRYILTVLEQFRVVIHDEYKSKLNHLLKFVGGEIKGSIWWRQIWEERELQHRVRNDEQLAKKLLFLGPNKEATMTVINKYDITHLNAHRMNMIHELQQSMIDYIKRILNHNDIDISTLAIHIKLNLLNNNDYVRLNLLSKMYDIVHDRDRPRGPKPEKTLKKIREQAKLSLIKKEEAAKRKKKKRIRIQTSAKHLQKLANVAPSASDIQKKYHDSILKQRVLIGQRKRRLMEILEKRRRNRMTARDKHTQNDNAPPALEGFVNEPPLKRRRKSSRIESFGERRTYIEPEIEQYVTYQFEFAIVSNWNEFFKSGLLTKYNKDILSDYNQFQTLFTLLFVGLHIDFEDEYHEWYEGIIQKVRISPKSMDDMNTNNNSFESDAKTQSCNNNENASVNNSDCDLFNKYNVKLLVHFKNFSAFWDSWIELPSSRISVLRTYSNAYDVHDNVKPLAEIIRELDESQIVSIDFISESLSLARDTFVKWINSEQVQWHDANTVDKLLKWTKNFLLSNKTITMNENNVISSNNKRNNKRNTKFMMISKNYFVKAGSYSSKCEHMICEAVLPNTLDVNLKCLDKDEIDMIQETVIDNLKQKKCDYFNMSNQCGIPLGLFQQIVFGITDLLPQFIVNQVVNWAKGIHLENLDHAIKEEQLFYVKIE